MIIGGILLDDSRFDTTWIYDTITKEFLVSGNLNVARNQAGCGVFTSASGDKVALVVGGKTDGGVHLDTWEKWTESSGTWLLATNTLPSSFLAANGVVVVHIDNRLLLMTAYPELREYDEDNDLWVSLFDTSATGNAFLAIPYNMP